MPQILVSIDTTPRQVVKEKKGFLCDVKIQNQSANTIYRGTSDTESKELNWQIGAGINYFDDKCRTNLWLYAASASVVGVEVNYYPKPAWEIEP